MLRPDRSDSCRLSVLGGLASVVAGGATEAELLDDGVARQFVGRHVVVLQEVAASAVDVARRAAERSKKEKEADRSGKRRDQKAAEQPLPSSRNGVLASNWLRVAQQPQLKTRFRLPIRPPLGDSQQSRNPAVGMWASQYCDLRLDPMSGEAPLKRATPKFR